MIQPQHGDFAGKPRKIIGLFIHVRATLPGAPGAAWATWVARLESAFVDECVDKLKQVKFD